MGCNLVVNLVLFGALLFLNSRSLREHLNQAGQQHAPEQVNDDSENGGEFYHERAIDNAYREYAPEWIEEFLTGVVYPVNEPVLGICS